MLRPPHGRDVRRKAARCNGLHGNVSLGKTCLFQNELSLTCPRSAQCSVCSAPVSPGVNDLEMTAVFIIPARSNSASE